MKRIILRTEAMLLLLFVLTHSFGQQKFSALSGPDKKLYKEHIVLGQPDGDVPIYVRQGYVLKYNTRYRIPDWVCYHIIPDYLNHPKREGRFSSFKTDKQILNPVLDPDYTGSSYARGHMAPFFAMGGDRDGNDTYSNAHDDSEDPYDDATVYQANFMSNICPQDQDALNGSGGPWYKLETLIRDKLVGDKEMELNVFAGSIIDDPDDYKILKNKKGKTGIAIPDRFYQILIYKDKSTNEYITGGFLFPHVTNKRDLPFDNLFDYMVSVDSIEVETGLDFLSELKVAKQKKIESNTNREFWVKLSSKK